MSSKLDYAARETLSNLQRNVFMTVAAVLVVAVSLFLVGGVLLLSFALDRAVNLQTRKVEVAVFLAQDIAPEERDSIQRDLGAMPEVASVQYESKQEAFERFKQLFRDEPEIVENTTAAALPESFRVKLKDAHQYAVVHDRLQGRPGIDKIRDDRSFLKRFLAVVRDIRTIGWMMVVLLAGAAGVLIATTIRMAIYARRKEVAIMKLVGATNWFIRVPFMLEGVVQGIIGTVVAIGLLLMTRPLFTGLARSFRFLGVNVSIVEILQRSSMLFVAGILIGALGSLLGLRRFLEV